MTQSKENDVTERSRFDSDPEALAWARGKIEREVERLDRFEQQALDRGDNELALRWRRPKNLLKMNLIGGEGCVIAAFDKRLPDVLRAMPRDPILTTEKPNE